MKSLPGQRKPTKQEKTVRYYVMMEPAMQLDFTWTVVGGPWYVREPADTLQEALEGLNKPRQTRVVMVEVLSHE